MASQESRGQDPLARLIRPHLLRMAGYQPIRPVEAVSEEEGRPAADIVKLDGNENPYGCSPRVRHVLAEFPWYHLYPDPEQSRLRTALARYMGLKPENIVAGAGSDEIIDLLLRLTLEPGDAVVDCVPTFGMYRFSTELCGGRVVAVPRRADFGLDMPAVTRALGGAKVTFVASPNNPSGNLPPQAEIEELLKGGVLVVVDEAYHEFSGETVAPLVPRYRNLVVLRTFSKWAGLAGLRVGYGAMAPELAARLMQIKPPYNVNAAAEVAALAALEDATHLHETVRKIVAERERLSTELSRMPYLTVYPSRANFLLCRVAGVGPSAEGLHAATRRKGVLLRYFNTPYLKDCLRVSVGRPEDTDRLLTALRQAWEECRVRA